VFLISGGGPMDDPRAREAIQYAVPWAQVAQEAFPDRDAPIAMTSMPEGMTLVKPEEITIWEVLDARNLDYDPELAKMLLAEAGYPDGFSAAFLFALDDEELVLMAEMMASSLGEVGIGLETDSDVIELRYVLTPAEQLVTELVKEGTPVLWLSRQ
jgi:ABC-type transport system substrate-binding protein